MAQISYGTITITDTTDIERIYPVYCKGGETTAPTLQPLSNWSEIVSQAGGTGDYIWQRIVTKKQDIAVTINDYSDAVRLTGDDGAALTITSIQYAQTQNENDTPSYGNSMPSSINEGWWLWVKTTYSDGQSSVTKVKQGQKGDAGQRGTSILKVTTAPSVYTTTQGGFTPSYRMSLSTVKTESGKTEVLVGDIIEYNSNHYRVGYVSSSYVYLSAATSIKGADGQTYYTWIKYAPNDNPTNAQISDSPTGMTYIGIYTGTTTPAPSTANSYAPWMKYIGTNGGEGPQGISVTGTRELYWLKTTTNPSQITWNSSTSQPSQTIYSTDRQNSWTSVVPTYEANAVYYTCIETSLSNATKSWSAPTENKGLTNANQKALDAYNTSTARDTEVNALKAQAKHFWWDSEGAHIAAGQNTTSVDNITQGQPDTYTFNALTAPGFLKLRYKNIDFAQLATNSLTFYRPAVNGSTYVQGKKAMDLTADALTFYKPLAYNSSNEPTAAATLNANGLVLSEGGIKAGTSRANGFIYLSSANFADTISGHTAGTVSLDNYTATDWRQLIGTKFGVRADGTLYASNAVISGTITVGSGSTIDSGATIGGTSASTVVNNASTGAGAASDLATYKTTVANTYATQDALSDVENQIPDVSGLASKSAAIAEEQLIYIQATSGTNSVNAYPSSSTTTSSYWVTQTGESIPNGTPPDSATGQTPRWTTKRPSYQKNYPVIFVAKQKKTVSGAITCTTPIKDDTTTIIDGGHITTGTIDASKVTVTNLQANSIAVGNSNVAAALDTKASSSAEYEVVIKVNSINYDTPSATLIAIPTKLGESTTGTFVWYKNTIGTAHGGTVSTTTTGNTNDTLTVSDLEALYIAVLQ